MMVQELYGLPQGQGYPAGEDQSGEDGCTCSTFQLYSCGLCGPVATITCWLPVPAYNDCSLQIGKFVRFCLIKYFQNVAKGTGWARGAEDDVELFENRL